MHLETPRLYLRQPCEADLDSWAEIYADPSARFLGGQLTRTQSWGALAATIGHWNIRGFGLFSVISKSSGECLGYAGPYYPEGWPEKEIGWALRRAYWHQGLATEATQETLEWSRKTMRWRKVIHCIHPENRASAAVAVRIGSTFLGEARLPLGSAFIDLHYRLYGQDLSPS